MGVTSVAGFRMDGSNLIADPPQTRCSSFHHIKLNRAHSSIKRIFLLALNDVVD
jgi:hypothetical protein